MEAMKDAGRSTFAVKRDALIPLRLQHLPTVRLSPPARVELVEQVELALADGPWSVVREKSLAPSGDPHDYTSLAPYWWPNPETSDGMPWVRRDGEVNPVRYEGDCTPLFKLCNALRMLALGHGLLGDERCAPRIELLLRTWCLDPATRMNPDMRFTQCVPGVEAGASFGLIDMNLMPGALDALALVDGSIAFDVAAGVGEWFGDLADWFIDSDLGREAASALNHHATWWLVQVVAFLCAAGRKREAVDLLSGVAVSVAGSQIARDGRQEHELKRTLSFSYSVYNLTAFCFIGIQARRLGVDLGPVFRDRLSSGVRFLLPYVGEVEWPYWQIDPIDVDAFVPIVHWAGRLCRDETLTGAAAGLAAERGWRDSYRGYLLPR